MDYDQHDDNYDDNCSQQIHLYANVMTSGTIIGCYT